MRVCGCVFVCYLDLEYIPISNELVTISFACVVAIAGVNAYVQTMRRPDIVINIFYHKLSCRYDGYH